MWSMQQKCGDQEDMVCAVSWSQHRCECVGDCWGKQYSSRSGSAR